MPPSDALEARRPSTYTSFFPELAGQAGPHPFAERQAGRPMPVTRCYL
jgi:hypothetical protein